LKHKISLRTVAEGDISQPSPGMNLNFF